MLKITFYNVGQGDAILLEWQIDNNKKVGIIDCNKFPGPNKIVEYLSQNQISSIEFLILSHFHYDHYSGISDIFKYCLDQKIKVKYFLHTFVAQVLQIYDQIFYSKREEGEMDRFIKYYELLDVENEIIVDCYTKELNLDNGLTLKFYSPDGKAYTDIAKKISRRKNKVVTTREDVNRLATIIKVYRDDDCLILTSDAVKKSFIKIRELISDSLLLIQVPHHGSFENIDEKFYDSLNYEMGCPAILSVGDEPKDELPDRETVEFFDKRGFELFSTNCVYGINDYFFNEPNPVESNISSYLDHFSSKKRVTYLKPPTENRFMGDKCFVLFK